MGTAQPGKGEKVADWADGRLGLYSLAKTQMRKVFPDHWSFMLGEVCLYSFLILILTGVYLTLFFEPSAVEVVYNGSYERPQRHHHDQGVRVHRSTSASTCAADC
jgi:ubiquinol-cytochrome c reductase cytochrome b subunit